MAVENRDSVKRAEWTRRYLQENADRIRDYHRQYRARHRETVKAQARERARKWVAANRQRHNANASTWRKANPDKVRKTKQRSREKDGRDAAWLELQKTIAALS